MTISKIKKRDGSIVDFDKSKIVTAIDKTLRATKSKDGRLAESLANEVIAELDKRTPKNKIPSVEDVQELVEDSLIRHGLTEAAKAYILYREKHAEMRGIKEVIGVKDELKMTVNAVSVLERRYLLKNEISRVIESPSGMFRRVAKAVASADKKYGNDVKISENDFFQAMSKLEFVPNSPTLMNAGTDLGQLSACFVIPVEDSLDSIFTAVHDAAKIQQSGGGTGFSFSHLRPKGDIVRSTRGVASGPVSFMRVFNMATETIKQGGKRRGANMGILHVSHPDIVEFISCKSVEGQMENFNLSVAVDDKFMKAVEKDKEYELINPRTNQVVKRVRARDIWNLIVTMAWKTGDPGIIFIDEINRKNPTPRVGIMESTNPCGEQPLLPYESCNLGSINLSKFVVYENRKAVIDWIRLKKAIHLGVHFLDNVIDVNKFPLQEIEKVTREGNRKIGLGVMGFADMLVQLGIPYDSDEAIEFGEELMKFVEREAVKASEELGKRRGNFPYFKDSIWKKKTKHIRNATVTTVAPTGTISIIANCSSGIEPLFAVSYIRNVMEGTKLFEINPFFEQLAKEKGFYTQELMARIARSGSIQGFKEIPETVRKIFKTAHDINPEWHVKMQAAFQKHCDNAVSKTINFSKDATIQDVENAYSLAYKLKCKGITIYRYDSKANQVLNIGEPDRGEKKFVTAESEYSGGCPFPFCPGA